jgi:hypothetical protein
MLPLRTAAGIGCFGSLLAASAPALSAQSRTSSVAVRGVAFDSLRGVPLNDAIVIIVGTARSTTTDARGRFQFDSVTPGPHTFAVQHAALDSVGFSGIAARATVTDGRDEVRVTVPSFASLWGKVCRGPVPKDSGFVYGSVRDAVSSQPIRNAVVDLTWLDLTVEGKTRVSQTSWRGQARSDSNGGYSICGLPIHVTIRARASTDSTSSGLVDLVGRGARVQRRDFYVSGADSAAVAHGTVAGTVTDTAGRPFPDARIVMDEAAEVRTDANGRFTIRGVPVGTRQVEVLAIGMSPVIAPVDVMPNETASVVAALRRITTLDVVRVTGSRNTRYRVTEFEARRKTSAGYIRDSSQIAQQGTIASAFSTFSGVQVERDTNGSNSFYLSMAGGARGRCVPNLWIDDVIQRDYDYLNFIRPSEIAAIEVYPRVFSAPNRYMASINMCGSVVVWTKREFQ